MPAFFMTLALLLIIIIPLLYIVVRVRIEYSQGEKLELRTTFIFPRIPRFKNEYEFENCTMPTWSPDKRIKARLLKYILIDELNWKTVIGMEDAMYTALSTGSIWACKGTLISYLKNKQRLKQFEINVEPDFSAQVLLSELDCIIKLRIGHIIHIAVLLLNLLLKEQYQAKKTQANIWIRNTKPVIMEQVRKWGCWHGDARGKA
ncbi:MAG: DUF2953 domain-containing protein [Syntrophomonadaceae bacterium]|nr:DUF2953 domain-containing protein [Syntrophomonadaceae bacterium]